MTVRTGIGYDIHRFDSGRPLMLGGVLIEGHPGLAGHSDADVVCHAIADALLGAVALGDIGTHFPDSDPAWAGVSGAVLLVHIADKLRAWTISSIDTTIIAETPTLSGYVPRMRDVVAGVLEVSTSSVSIKATTSEGLGALGRSEGIACMAVATVWKS